MTTFEEMKGEMPYKESPGYVRELVGRCKETALRTPVASQGRRTWLWSIAAAAAIVVAVVGIALSVPRRTPIERFLAGITDEEAAMITCYNLEEIPEYVNE